MSERLGPLTATSEGLAIGDVPGRNVLLARQRIVYRDGEVALEQFSWESLERLDLKVPVTRWLHPWIGDFVLPLAFAAVAWVIEMPEPKTVSLEVSSGDLRRSFELAPHHAVGYSRTGARRAQALVRDLLGSADLRRDLDDSRSLLRQVRPPNPNW
ncbi:hypothetical protein JD292_07165 [Leucobacter sp. CSA2]|uniref:Uncharacterized protein n=1 Tax=Leucobacter edaphi TaxID=2796472 RepID=A0A934UXP9_9MICO|nr:hypothetical protein [Leucobacter edaphi]MBK0421851.1 hypothetical protein [Leucobacter edaphi]